MKAVHADSSADVADEEDLARFLTSSNQSGSGMPKPSAFMPSPKSRETSVFRHGADPIDRLWRIAVDFVVGQRKLHGAAIVTARAVRESGLEVCAEEPPPRHAVIRGWPWNDSDLAMQRAQQKELAARIASRAKLHLC